MDLIGDTAKLTINDAHTEDTGDYACQIWNEVGQAESSFKITVQEQKGKPERSRAQHFSVPDIQVEKPVKPAEAVYEDEGPKKPAKKVSLADRKVSKNNQLDMIDEAGSKYIISYFLSFRPLKRLKLEM